MAIRALVIDDDVRLFELLHSYLEQHGVHVAHASNGLDGLSMLGSDGFDVVLLDVMMPPPDGLTVLKKLRAFTTIPVIMLTARGDETDRVVGLELGADDYVAKPFSPRELLARLRAVLRRMQPDPSLERLSAGGVVIDLGARTAQVDGRSVDLTGLEFDILLALVRRAGRVIPRSMLLTEAGRTDVIVGERTVDVHISRLRKKIGDDPKHPQRIRTVRGVGYVLPREPP
ncbi:MAG TPA: response regulator transcription factor [Polyangiaceae bacterium]|nr:response regulator transcription factor [Polyangiaceae bacterium]